MTWTPFGSSPEDHSALVDGTPDWMLSSLREIFEGEFLEDTTRRTGYPSTGVRVNRIRKMELATHRRPFASYSAPSHIGAAFSSMTPADRLVVLDWVVKDNAENNESGSEEIERVLREGGSCWKVGQRQGRPGLETRVPEGVQDAADAAMSLPGDAGRLLSEAWHSIYGMNPQPDLGYRKSIEALESVVLPIVLPNDSTATLGKAIGRMRADGDWTLPFIKEHSQNPTKDVVLGMMQALWSGHSDRHPGTSSYVPSTPEAAEAAVSIAVTLMNLFANGGITRRQSNT